MQRKQKVDPKIFIVEGNIGSGKSTFLSILKKRLNLEIIYEPTDKWQNITKDGDNLLDMFYKDRKRWSYTFQSYAFISRLQSIIEAINKKPDTEIFILERSVFCDRFCFAKNLYDSGELSALEWQIYQEWFDWLVQTYSIKPSGFIYLKTDHDVCYQRMIKRDRIEEVNVPISYLNSLGKKHDDWLIHKNNTMKFIEDVPVLTIDANKDFQYDLEYQNQILKEFQKFINDKSNILLSQDLSKTIQI